jgi:hypothetical protein
MLEGWRFEPATWKGKPVEQARTKTTIKFAITDSQERRGASKRFLNFEREFKQLLEDGDRDGAGALLDSTFQESGWNLYETTRLWIASYRLHAASGDDENQLKSLRRAASGRKFVRPETAIKILRGKFTLEVRLGKLADALETYDLLISEGPAISQGDPLVEAAGKIREFVDGDQAIATHALIETSVWPYRLLRRKFSIDTVDGKIKGIDIRCDWHRARDAAVEVGKVWTIPPSWGSCRLYVHGSEGTTFRLMELLDEQL